MKRSFIPFLLAAIIALGLVFSTRQDLSVGATDFESKLRAAMKRQSFSIVNEEEVSQEELSLPVLVRWHPRRWGQKTLSQEVATHPDGVLRIGLVRDGTSRVDCFVRYLDGRAQAVEIRAEQKQTRAGTEFRSVLTQEFPSLPIKLQIQ